MASTQNTDARFEDFVGLVDGLHKEIQRIKANESEKLGLKGADVMVMHYLARSKEGLTGAQLAREAGVTRAAISRTLGRLKENGFVEYADGADAARYRALITLTAEGEKRMKAVDEIVQGVIGTTSEALSDTKRKQMYSSMRQILETLKKVAN